MNSCRPIDTLGLILGILFFSAGEANAQTKSAASAPPPAPQHVESVTYDNWVVMCQDSGNANKICVANLKVYGSGGKQIIASWQIGYDKEKNLLSVLQAPTSLTATSKDNKVSSGLLVKNGAVLKLGASAARRLSYLACTPSYCEAVAPVDDAFVRDAALGGVVSVTLFASDGTPVPFTFDAKSLDKAIAAVVSKKIE